MQASWIAWSFGFFLSFAFTLDVEKIVLWTEAIWRWCIGLSDGGEECSWGLFRIVRILITKISQEDETFARNRTWKRQNANISGLYFGWHRTTTIYGCLKHINTTNYQSLKPSTPKSLCNWNVEGHISAGSLEFNRSVNNRIKWGKAKQSRAESSRSKRLIFLEHLSRVVKHNRH